MPKSMLKLFALAVFALAGCSAVWGADFVVEVSPGGNDTFSPSTVTINTGDTVTFKLISGSHNVVSDTTGLFRCANGCDGSGGNGDAANNWSSVTLPFNTAGTFGYYCEPHGAPGTGMHGTIRVNAPAFSITSGLSGLWYNQAQSGHGFDIQFPGNGVALAVWYTFDNVGNNVWIIGQGTYSGNKATLSAYTTTGGFFPPNFPTDPNKISRTQWGTLTFTFSDCNNTVAAWVPLVAGYVSGTMPLTRLSGIGGLSCP